VADDRLQVAVVDDGIGLPVERRTGVGLRSMQERATELGGACTIEALPGGGTAVRAWLPLLNVEQGPRTEHGATAHSDRG
jgi:signal transduction histidine kinase